ncbi:uncharacterized protein LOC124922385 [Impatiens glandulifera]|uniref:uncharacterized protein LOC124922385 n=1 Tax=Impatiens glandulifera TaxID=253017 RepID=UPI001FB0E9E1|nr:uncharacterized protein LOC124922385 [Impatiens glandulifera]
MSLSRGSRNRGGEDRFYCPPAMRRHQQPQQQQQQRMQSNSIKSPKSNSNASLTLTDAEKRIKSDDGSSATTMTTITAPLSPSSSSLISTPRTIDLTNLDRFLEHTTPSVPAQYISKTASRGGWRWREQKSNPYFILGDLWESFKEWSAYGAGVPLVLSYSDSAVQYYVPFLSAIQLYIDPSKQELNPRRRPGEESDADSSRETSSDGSSEYMQGGYNQITRVNGGGSPGNEGDTTSPPGLLIFEYLEHDLPYGREPLADKIEILASRFPKLTTLRSCDLTPASWVSVAWYPIYRIPVGSSLQNLEACFLTFHSLSTTPLRSMMNTRELDSPIPSSKMLLPTFGLASYKLKVSVWNNLNGVVEENQKVGSLQMAAENWLRRLRVNHPDYSFFISHSSYIR